MATKTVVCPECGAAAAPGRYACADCGALLASVAVTPRSASTVNGGDLDEVEQTRTPTHAPTRAEPDPPDGRAPHAGAPDVAGALALSQSVDRPDRAPVFEAPAVEPAAAPLEADPPTSAEPAFDEDAPLGSATVIHEGAPPDVLHEVGDVPPDGRDSTDGGSLVGGQVATTSAASDEAGPESVPPAWPPIGDRGVVARPEPRTPAGSYLPPSAVLPPLDGGRPVAIAAPAAASTPTTNRTTAATAWAGRSSAALGDALEEIELTTDGARRAVAIGAGIAAFGMLLPWVNGLPAAGPFAGYLDRWGLAGPGMWLVLAALVALAAVALWAGRPATWPVALPAVALATFLGGLVWPYLLGGFGRSFGIWVVLAGAIVLGVGGVLDRRDRRGDAASAAPSDVGGR